MNFHNSARHFKPILTLLFLLLALNLSGQLPNTLKPAEKVFGLSKFWQEVNYNFVYLDKTDRAKWDNEYLQLITTVQNTKNDYEYYRELQKFCAMLKDGHTNVFMPQVMSIGISSTLFGDYQLFLENIDGKAIVTRINLSRKDEIPIGSEVVEVNGQKTADYIANEVAPYISSSTDYVLKDLSIANLLQGVMGEKYDVKIKRPQGDTISLNLTHKAIKEAAVYPPYEKQRDLLEFRWISKQVAYVSLNSFENPKIDSLFIKVLPELYTAKGLIIDLRNNSGGSTGIGTYILQYLTKDTILYGSKSVSRLHIPAYKAWGKNVSPSDTMNNEWASKALLSYQDKYFVTLENSSRPVEIQTKPIVIPTAILTGHKTASAAEDFLIYADNQRHMIRIGENTFGSTGQPYVFKLPGGGSARVCTKKDTYPDGREFVGYGIKPNIEVRTTVDDYLKKRDPVLDRAVDYLNGKLK
jgi:C-terminal processing protease CtpA/Prc